MSLSNRVCSNSGVRLCFFGTDFTDYAVLCWGRAEDRGRMTEDRGQRTDDRGQRTEDGGQRADGGNGGLCKLMLKDLAKVQRRVLQD